MFPPKEVGVCVCAKKIMAEEECRARTPDCDRPIANATLLQDVAITTGRGRGSVFFTFSRARVYER